MNWTNLSEKQPASTKNIHLRHAIKKTVLTIEQAADMDEGWVDWLDESATSFTLPEALEIYHNAWAHGVELSHPIAEEFFKTRFNIEI